jgi:hypothetical protein
MVMNRVTANAEPNSKANVRQYMVAIATCTNLATVAGEEGLDSSDLRVLFGPFTYVEARSFIVSAFRGGANISTIRRPIVTEVHEATMFVHGDESDDYSEYIVENWKASHYVDTDCAKFPKHHAEQL